jgi:N6-L-threonylcarbamoyladenine synthase
MGQSKSREKIRLLTIESTCDETAAAVISGDGNVLSSIIASQNDLHAAFSGVVPEIAARAHVGSILPVINEAMNRAGASLHELDAIAVATHPGLAGSLLVGLLAAKALCVVLDKPLIEVNHIHAHLYACQLGRETSIFPCVGLVVSGGHTSLYRCLGANSFELLGSTIDDAAGEAFDKVAAMMGLGFPGGPALARLAEQGDPAAYAFPRSFPNQHGPLCFSFSGLKTAVRYALAKAGRNDLAPPLKSHRSGSSPRTELELTSKTMADIAAGFQAAVIDVLIERCAQAIKKTRFQRLCIGGGVAANRALRSCLVGRMPEKCEIILAPAEYCTDNAAMGAISLEQYFAGEFATLDVDCRAGLLRPKKVDMKKK